jgi:hypothetical protein
VSVLQLHKPFACADVVQTLRRVADDIEAGKHGDWPVTTAIVVIGHSDAEFNDGKERAQRSYWDTYAAGPRADSFTVRGLLATVISRWNDRD